MCPAIHISSRSWLRSSSTHEPSDPPLRIVFYFLRSFLVDDDSERREETDMCGKKIKPRRPAGERGCFGRSPLSTERPAADLPGHRQASAARPTFRGYSPGPRRGGKGPGVHAGPAAAEPCPVSERCPEREAETTRVSRTLSFLGERRESERTLMILPQVHLRKPCYDFYFL